MARIASALAALGTPDIDFIRELGEIVNVGKGECNWVGPSLEPLKHWLKLS